MGKVLNIVGYVYMTTTKTIIKHLLKGTTKRVFWETKLVATKVVSCD